MHQHHAIIVTVMIVIMIIILLIIMLIIIVFIITVHTTQLQSVTCLISQVVLILLLSRRLGVEGYCALATGPFHGLQGLKCLDITRCGINGPAMRQLAPGLGYP